MAMRNPVGRTNYEPNSWDVQGDPRETPQGFHSYPAQEQGQKMRVRSETFADHYSQARQFYISQTRTEQRHLENALVFELSKVERPEIRSRMVSHLLNIDSVLAQHVADGLRLQDVPAPAQAAKPTRTDLQPSDALSILKNGPQSFKGRKLGILVTDGVDIALFNALVQSVKDEGATYEVVAPMIGGVQASDGTMIPANQKINGGPSVLYDAVALLISEAGAPLISQEATARDFVADAFAHVKFIGYTQPATVLFDKAGISQSLDDACIALTRPTDAASFIKACRALRFWDREAKVNVV